MDKEVIERIYVPMWTNALAYGNHDAQEMALIALRSHDHACRAEGYGDAFHWLWKPPGQSRWCVIYPQAEQDELTRLTRIERAARAYVESDPPRPEWRDLAHALASPHQEEYEHPVAGILRPHREPCSSFMPDGRSEICARCDWPEDAHGSRGD